MEFVADYLKDEILKMESLFEKIKEEGDMVNKEDQMKYEDLKVAIELLDEHNDVMKYLMNVAEHKEEEEEIKAEIKTNKEIDTSSDDDEDDNDDDEEGMDIDIYGFSQKGKGGNQ
jgi:hypothetical protein